ncbi:50S ribosomal protein L21 [Thermocoleostomius sinensis]|jgi:large subunit ribosomal protein L21|uniref:Large ribosomal subunit protein bL21 n=1 Tax=Thermocoleostomius sinensis A174 TaxID=2016057 RepID=A0A9E9C5L7_9CYAN|nr:50S ribosomal protein L21 [Thermocoleostomius sinensis]WAL61291.1 50S ribosomal protein L21 [Thermocoleostomius sinensis A174]
MAYAIIETGGKQLRVEPGRFYDIERLAVEEEDAVTIDRVLFIDNDGESHVGQPLIEGATVEATVLSHLRGRKIIVYKMRPKKKTRKKQGHRQELTRVMINSISVNGNLIAASTASTDSSAPATESVAPTADDEATEE